MPGGKAPGAEEVLEIIAPAKVNLFLHITGRRDNGYHELESLFAFTKGGDRLTLEPANEITLTIGGPFGYLLDGQAEDNLVVRAAHALQSWAGIQSGARIHLDKNLPVAAGIGGGSADAAAALKGLVDLWSLSISELELANLSLPLGADIPACLSGHAKMVRGIGEIITLCDMPFETHILLVNPGVPLTTPAVFREWARTDAPFHQMLGSNDMPSVDFISRHSENSLQAPAMEVAPVIAECLDLIASQPGLQLSRMSGSGATCFGLFETVEQAEAAVAAISKTRPDWWVHADELQTS